LDGEKGSKTARGGHGRIRTGWGNKSVSQGKCQEEKKSASEMPILQLRGGGKEVHDPFSSHAQERKLP